MDIANEYLSHVISGAENTMNEKSACVKLLELVTDACPGLGLALLVKGKVKMHIGDLNGKL